MDAAETFQDEEALDMARSAARFIVKRLPRSVDTACHLCFSYIPAGQTLIYNNSALAGAFLARLGRVDGVEEYVHLAKRVMRYLADAQSPDGHWVYGEERFQNWIDGFHTGYILCALSAYQRLTGDRSFADVMENGYRYYKKMFFTPEFAPKYFYDQLYPIDIHSCTQAIITFSQFSAQDQDGMGYAERSAHWMLDHMQNPDGSFCYQKHRFRIDRTPYMRWGQAWALRAMAVYWSMLHSGPGAVRQGAEPCAE